MTDMDSRKKKMNVIEMKRHQSELYESIMHLDPNVMENIGVYEEVISKDIVIDVGSICNCGADIEHHLTVEEHQALQMVDKVSEFIRRGECRCGAEGPGHHKSQRVRLTFAHIAAYCNNVELLRFLASSGCTFNQQTEILHLTPVFIAVTRKHEEAVDFLLSQDIDINTACTKDHITPLMRAVLCRKKNLVQKILSVKGVDLNIRNTRGESPVLQTLRWQLKEIFDMLLEAGADVNAKDQHQDCNLLMLAAVKGVEYMKKLLEKGAAVNTPNSRNETALHFAVYVDSVDSVKTLLDAKADPDIATSLDDMTPIVIAASQGSTAVVEVLAKHGADINKANHQCYNAVHMAAWNCHTQMLKILLQCEGVNHDLQTRDKNTPLSLAAHGNHPEAINMLLALGCDVNNKDKDDDTALLYATYNGMTDSVRTLLQHNADPDVKNKVQATPLWNAVYGKHKEVVKLLLAENVEMEVKSVGINQHYQSDVAVPLYPQPVSPLYVALHRGCTEIVYLLLSAGYNIYKEQWVYTKEYPTSENSDHLMSVLTKQASQPPRLISICRNFIRRYGDRRKLSELVNSLELPAYLKNYLMMTQLLSDSVSL